MELIYIATSTQFPGKVKIGRTDRDIETRMEELSNDDYGVEGFSGDSEWEVPYFFQVEDNEAAERLIHEQFDDLRVSDNRELFYSDDPASIAEQAAEISGGSLIDAADPSILDAADPVFLEEAFDTLMQYGLMMGVGFVAGRIVHKKIKDKPKYKEQLRKADTFYKKSKQNLSGLRENTLSQEHQDTISDGYRNVKKRWDDTKDNRKKLLDDSKTAGKRLWSDGSNFIKSTSNKFKSKS